MMPLVAGCTVAPSSKHCSPGNFCRIKLKTASGSLTIRYRRPSNNSNIILPTAEVNSNNNIIAETQVQMISKNIINDQEIERVEDISSINNIARTRRPLILASKLVCNSCSNLLYDLRDSRQSSNDFILNQDEYSDDIQTFGKLTDLVEVNNYYCDVTVNGNIGCFNGYTDLQPDYSPYHFWAEDNDCTPFITCINADSCREYIADIPDGSNLIPNISRILYNDHIIAQDCSITGTALDIIGVNNPSILKQQKHSALLPKVEDSSYSFIKTDNIISKDLPPPESVVRESLIDDSELINQYSESEVLLNQSNSETMLNLLCSEKLLSDDEASICKEEAFCNSSLNSSHVVDREGYFAGLIRFPWPFLPWNCRRKRKRRSFRRASTTVHLSLIMSQLLPSTTYYNTPAECSARSIDIHKHSSFVSNSHILDQDRHRHHSTATATAAAATTTTTATTATTTNKLNMASKRRKSSSTNLTNVIRRNCLPARAVEIMQEWMDSHIVFPFASKEEKMELALSTGLTVAQVDNWLSNARYKMKCRKQHRPQLNRSPKKRGRKKKKLSMTLIEFN